MPFRRRQRTVQAPFAALPVCSHSSSRGSDLEPPTEASDASVSKVTPRESNLHSGSLSGATAGLETSASEKNRVTPYTPSNLAVDSNLMSNSVNTSTGVCPLPVEGGFDATREYSTSDMIFFWQPSSLFSQWAPSSFTVDGVSYNCAEQFFASEKARLFGDADALRNITGAHDPRLHKRYDRVVRGFDPIIWDSERENIVLMDSYAKFSQNPAMRHQLLASGDKLLVEASPADSIWSVGLRADHPDILHSSTWRGLNLLGSALQKVRHMLSFREPSHTRSVRLSSSTQSPPVRSEVHEVHPSTHQRLAASTSPSFLTVSLHFLLTPSMSLRTTTVACGPFLPKIIH